MGTRLATYLACPTRGNEASKHTTSAAVEAGKPQRKELRRSSTLAGRFAAPTLLSRRPELLQQKPGIARHGSYLPHRPSDMNRENSILFHNFENMWITGDIWGFEYAEDLREILEFNVSAGIGRSINFVREPDHPKNNGCQTESVWIVQAPQLFTKYGDRLSSERLTDDEMERLNERFEKEQASDFPEVIWQSTATDKYTGRVVAYKLSLAGHPWRGAYSAGSSATQSPVSNGSSSPKSAMQGRNQPIPILCLNLDSIEDSHEARKQWAKALKDLSDPVDTTKRDGGSDELDCNDSGVNLENATPAPVDDYFQGL